jgi:hypothetical protein
MTNKMLLNEALEAEVAKAVDKYTMMSVQEPITYDRLLKELQSNFGDFVFEIKSGSFEQFIHVRTKYFLVAFNIWYSARERTIEVTDTLPGILKSAYRDRIKLVIGQWGRGRGTGLLFELNRSKRRQLKRKLETYLQRF